MSPFVIATAVTLVVTSLAVAARLSSPRPASAVGAAVSLAVVVSIAALTAAAVGAVGAALAIAGLGLVAVAAALSGSPTGPS